MFKYRIQIVIVFILLLFVACSNSDDFTDTSTCNDDSDCPATFYCDKVCKASDVPDIDNLFNDGDFDPDNPASDGDIIETDKDSPHVDGDLPENDITENNESQPDECDPCRLIEASGKYCTVKTLCEDVSFCGTDNEYYKYSCESGECVTEIRDCTDDKQCNDWCLAKYIAMGFENPEQYCSIVSYVCEKELCSEKKHCMAYNTCDTNQDCPDATEHHAFYCENGSCLYARRPCQNNSQCSDWCKLNNTTEVCDKQNHNCDYNHCDEKSYCITSTKCESPAECSVASQYYFYTCEENICKFNLRECSSSNQCHDWCISNYTELGYENPADFCDPYVHECSEQ